MIIYSTVDREPIWVALFDKLKAALANKFKTMGRKHIAPTNLGAGQQPALFLVQVSETKVSKPRTMPGQVILHGVLVIYCQGPAVNETPGQETHLAATDLNDLKKSIDDALAPDPATGAQTLGGLVSHCWIEGDTEEDPGILSQQAAAGIPIHILCP